MADGVDGTIGDTGTGANNVTGVVADYGSIQAWHDAQPNNPDTNATGTIIRSSASVQTSTLTLSVPNSGARVLTVTAHADAAVTEPTRSEATSKARCTGKIVISGTGWILEKFSHVYSSGYEAFAMEVGASAVIRRMILLGEMDVLTRAMIVGGSGVVATVSNVAIIEHDFQIFVGVSGAGTANVYHCSVLSPSGVRRGMFVGGSPDTLNVYGVIVLGATPSISAHFEAQFSGTLGGNYNVSEDATAPGANSLTSQSGCFVDSTSGSEDLALDGSPAVNIVSRSGFPSDTDTDISGTTRPSTSADCGCWQTPSSATDKPVADSGAGSEAVAVGAAVPLADTGAGSDAVGVGAAAPVADTATGVSSVSVEVSVPVGDVGAGVDESSLTNPVGVSDTGTGSSGVEVAVGVLIPDTGYGVEALGLAAAVGVADAGAGVDVVSVPEAAVSGPARGLVFTMLADLVFTVAADRVFTEGNPS